MTSRTLREAIDAGDARRFAGRRSELAMCDRFLDEGAVERVLYIHGPGGIGKSALLRAMVRRAVARGFEPVALDGRSSLGEASETLSTALESAGGAPIIFIVDEADALGAALSVLRNRLLDVASAASRLVFASRTPPGPEWREGGLEAVFIGLPLGPLDDDGSRDLLRARDVPADHVDGILSWALGSPLALTVAAADPGEAPRGAGVLEERLTAWLTGRPHLDLPDDVIDVAAIAPWVDARLLAAALPGRPTRPSMAQLLIEPVCERRGDRVSLHPVLAAAVRMRLRDAAPERARLLTGRVASHLGARARLGDIGALVALSNLVEDPGLRAAISNRPSVRHYGDGMRSGELTTFARRHGFADGRDWPELQAWAQHPSSFTVLVRRASGDAVMIASFQSVADLQTRASAERWGPVSTSLLRAATATGVSPARSFVGFGLFADASQEDRIEALRLGGGVFMHQHGVPDVQAQIVHFPAPDRRPTETVSLLRDVPGGDGLPRPVLMTDFRPLGVAGFIEAQVMRELRLTARTDDAAPLLNDPARRDELRALLDAVFSDSPGDRRLRRVIEIAHLEQRRSEAECLAILHVSRRTWFRLLRTARERVATFGRVEVRDAGGQAPGSGQGAAPVPH